MSITRAVLRIVTAAIFCILVVLAVAPAAFAQSSAATINKAGLANLPPDTPIEAIVIKFEDGAGVRLGAGGKLVQKASVAINAPQAALLASVTKIEALAKSNGLKVRRHFASVSEEALDQWTASGEKRGNTDLNDLNAFYSLKVAPGTRFSQVTALVESIARSPFVEVAYAEPVPRNAQIATPNFEPSQTYLEPGPNGIDARYGWRLAGGLGDSVSIIDVEYMWNLQHEDVPAIWRSSGNGWNFYGPDHGTAVLGELAAPHNGFGVSGLSPNARIGISAVNPDQGISVAEAIQWAATLLQPGDIILIEQQRAGPEIVFDCGCAGDQCNFIPVEYGSAAYSAIRAATANGIIVVEAGGNGSSNLDSPFYFDAFNRAQRDSGAIIVGASSNQAREPLCFSNYGSRIDMHGWGTAVFTTGYGGLFNQGPNRTYGFFGGTSSASPIVTGAAAIIQGVRAAAGQPKFSPSQMRTVLSQTGTAQTGQLGRPIGPLPNVRAAIVATGSGPPPPDLRWLPAILNLILGD